MKNFVWILFFGVLSGFSTVEAQASVLEAEGAGTEKKELDYCEYIDGGENIFGLTVRPNGKTMLSRYINFQLEDVENVSNVAFLGFDVSNAQEVSFNRRKPLFFTIRISMTLDDAVNVQCLLKNRTKRMLVRTSPTYTRVLRPNGAVIESCDHEDLTFTRGTLVSLTQLQLDAVINMSFERNPDPAFMPKSQQPSCIETDVVTE